MRMHASYGVNECNELYGCLYFVPKPGGIEEMEFITSFIFSDGPNEEIKELDALVLKFNGFARHAEKCGLSINLFKTKDPARFDPFDDDGQSITTLVIEAKR